MRPTISVVGKSQSGKTTLLEKLIIELKQRGRRVAVIKHAGEFELDKEGKDSWRFSQAGSDAVVVSSPEKVAVIKQVERDLTPQELSDFIQWDCDLILTEGFKKSDTPKIEVHRKEQGKELLSPSEQLLAVVTDEPLDTGAPQFSKDDIKELADLIEEHVQAETEEEEIELFVNDAPVRMGRFVSDLLFRVLVAGVSGLKGVKEVQSLRITLRRSV